MKIKYIDHEPTLRTCIDETNPITVCTLQRFGSGEWMPISTCEVDRSELESTTTLAKELEGQLRRTHRKLKHRKVTVDLYVDGLYTSTQLEHAAKRGIELTNDYCKRLTDAICSMLEEVSVGG